MQSLLVSISLAGVIAAAGGCHWAASPGPTGLDGSSAVSWQPVENPLEVPNMDREFLWNQVVDTVDNYFHIEREDRVKSVEGVLTEGRIDTYPTIGSTLLEPWRSDSSPGYERLHATLQSIRRHATVRVSPTGSGYQIHVAVMKEKEEVTRAEHATIGSVTPRRGDTLVRADRRRTGSASDLLGSSKTIAWIPIGRDFVLEQRILNELYGRLLDPAAAAASR